MGCSSLLCMLMHEATSLYPSKQLRNTNVSPRASAVLWTVSCCRPLCRPATQLKLDFSLTQIGDAALLALLPAGAARLAAQLSSDRDGTESSGCGVPGGQRCLQLQMMICLWRLHAC